jgi:c-di-AMP phosphodiesterase-like protein
MVKISARSNGNINVQIILNEIGGGGHFNSAAGTFVGESVKDVVKKLKEAIDKYKL